MHSLTSYTHEVALASSSSSPSLLSVPAGAASRVAPRTDAAAVDSRADADAGAGAGASLATLSSPLPLALPAAATTTTLSETSS